ncbi:PfkB family carbohydrate kinase [Larkinella bovis]|uniref:PfkB family carbohydrate kinase n=1 Tax=Larkinella bovis TaxID=683041 RepID=A0ABW0IKI8_9BACT
MYDICTIGHITLDKVVTGQSVTYMPGGTAFYFTKALRQFEVRYKLITALAVEQQAVVDDIRRDGMDVDVLPSEHTVFFENIYSLDQDYREQNVHHTAAPFGLEEMPAVDARIYHLGPLLADDISVELLKALAQKGLVSLDAQGYLRYVSNKKVLYRDWIDKREALPHVAILKANEHEMEVMTGLDDPYAGARYLADLGVREVIITLGSKGSIVYTGNEFYSIPAFEPTAVVDATGCGDTYMAGYLWKKIKGASVQEAGEFGAAMATLKIESSGPFSGAAETVNDVLKKRRAGNSKNKMASTVSTFQ